MGLFRKKKKTPTTQNDASNQAESSSKVAGKRLPEEQDPAVEVPELRGSGKKKKKSSKSKGGKGVRSSGKKAKAVKHEEEPRYEPIAAAPGTGTQPVASLYTTAIDLAPKKPSEESVALHEDGTKLDASSTTSFSAGTGRLALPERAPAPFQLTPKDPYGDGLAGYEKLSPLGTGTFGQVLLVRRRKDQRCYALKILEKGIVVKLRQVLHVKSEKRTLSMIQSPFIVNIKDWFQDPDTLYLVMEYVPGGELFSRGKQSEANARFYAAEACIALEYLHTFNIVYRDIKPENTLIDMEGHVKLCDFSFAKEVLDLTWTICGTPEYMAPEIILSRGHGLSVDWWGLGVFMYELMAGRPPFSAKDQMALYTSILTVSYQFPSYFSPNARSIVSSLVEKDLTMRLGCLARGAQEVKEHPFFDAIDWDACAARKLTPPWTPTCRGADDTKHFVTTGQNFERRFQHHVSFGTLFDDF